MTIQWIIGIATVGIAGFIRGFSGFGSAMVIIPVLSLLLESMKLHQSRS
ncbi:MAG: hypothetical protein HC921_01500 [Synechococcaceae cyanobacterium SM2_3_1]|nr:hypothetical protein [Synechococcaceae cyanobacterium SM2_3_1]